MVTKNVNFMYEDIDGLLAQYDNLLKELVIEAKIMLYDRWIYMDNKDVFYDNKVVSIYPNLNKCELYNYEHSYCIEKDTVKEELSSILNFEGFKWDLMNYKECITTFDSNIPYPCKQSSKSIKYNGSKITQHISFLNETTNELNSIELFNKNITESAYLVIPIYRLNGVNSEELNGANVLKLWFENNLIPQDTAYAKLYEMFIRMSKNYNLILENDSLRVDREKLKEAIKSNKIELNFKKSTDDFIKQLLCGDKERADIEKYDEKIITDPNRGHWELWTDKEPENSITVSLDKELIARNPIADIKYGGVVGIDFGTKSTIVVHQEDSEYTLPMRVGVGQFRKTIEEKHYENPTVMEFINLENFINNYNKEKGRPFTKWEDLTISHTAFDDLMNSKSEDYYSYFNELKQWCGDKNKRIRIKDKNKKIFDLPTFLELKDNEFNPIEIYAYYLGLYINNLHNGIYLDYILSFPVTYEKEVREKIIISFEKGLKKSLPKQLHDNEDVMKNFRVSIGASEPAAYAISALQEYEFEPEDDEKVFYGVFDFGGGTTDFDFGIFREANGRKERKYDFVIEHFGAGGDKYLGGENILELLAFEVFNDNSETLREKGVTFILPPECKKFPGSEILLNESQESRINMRQVMEKLRPLWEMHEGYEKIYAKGIIATNLFDKDGNILTNFQLKIDINKLMSIIKIRIDKGVRNFFESLRLAFNNEKTTDIDVINIFLAGNSSKSEIVKELFDEYIQRETEEILKSKNIKSIDGLDEVATTVELDMFEIYPPLGTEDAYKKQEQLGIKVNKDNFKKPTGKTGVAFGLVESRPGGSIKVINMNQEDNETKFKFYIGENRRKKFKSIIDTETKYNTWYEFIDAYEEDFEVYYTSLPEASTGKLPISETSRIKCRLESVFEDEDVFVYVRAISPTCIEYVVAKESDINNEKYLSDIVKIQLN